MKTNLGSDKGILLIAVFLGTVLVAAPLGARASPAFIPGGHSISVVNNSPNTLFRVNATNSTGGVQFNLVGNGGNDTFILAAGNGSAIFLATGLHNNIFNISSGGGNSTFSLSSGANSTFVILEQNINGTVDGEGNPIIATQVFAITGGAYSVVNETSIGPVGNALYSINLGVNSTVSLGSVFAGNETIINILF